MPVKSARSRAAALCGALAVLAVAAAPAGAATKPVVTLTTPAAGSQVADPTPRFAGTAGALAGDSTTVTVRLYSGPKGSSSTLLQALQTTRSGSSYAVDARDALAPGTYTARASQKNSAGGVGHSAWVTFAVTQPSTPPPSECGWGAFSAANPPGACWRPYSDQSPFNRALPQSIAQPSNSAAIGDRTANFGAGAPVFRGGHADTDGDYGHSLYYSSPSDPLYTVHCVKDWGTCDVEGMQVRIPLQARATGGGDGHMGVIDQQNGVEYGFWQVLSKPAGGGTLEVSWGGKTAIGTPTATGLGSKATAAGYGLAAGVIRPEELAAGEINHALFMSVKCTNGTSVWPAGRNTGRICSELGLPNQDAPAMGAHFYLDMSEAQVAALDAPEWQRAILRAMVRYGMYVGDTGSAYNGWTIKVQSGTSYTSMGFADPWAALGESLELDTNSAGDYLFDLRDAINWQNELRVAQPCVVQGSC